MERCIAFPSIDLALDDLRNRGYVAKFMRDPECLYCIELHIWIAPEQFSVDVSYYLEKESSPDENRVFHAISSNVGIKGILVEACGVYADNISIAMAQKLSGDGNPAVRKANIETLAI